MDAAESVFTVFGLRQGLIESASVMIHMLVAQADFASAIALGRVWMQRLEDFSINEPMLIPGILDLIEAAATRQDSELFEELTARLTSAACDDRPDIDSAIIWAEALWLCSSRTDAVRAKSLLDGLVKVWADCGRDTWVARVQLLLGRLARREGARRVAAEHLTNAQERFDSAEMHAWSKITAAELARSQQSPATGNSLSKAETEAAKHAASGLTNKQIAQLLFVTERTVESHLNAVYRKLGITRRTQLHLALNNSDEAS